MNTTGSVATTTLPPLQAIKANWIKHLLGQPALLQELVDAYHSPINIHAPLQLTKNVQEYQAVFREHQLDHQIFFARKANRSVGLVREAARMDYGVDTASYRELEQCLAVGVSPNRLVLTAAIKNRSLLHLAIEHGVPIMLDNEDEVLLTLQLAAELNKKARIGLRVSNFPYHGEQLYSRFGVDIKDAYDFLKTYCCSDQGQQWLAFEGLHFHLNGYDPQQRGAALHQCLALAATLRKINLSTQYIDMGGGLLMNYLEHQQQWQAFDKALREAVQGQRAPITFNNSGLGYEMVDGELKGSMKVYPYYNKLARGAFLEEILAYRNEEGITAAQLTREAGISLRIEPGRSVLDQVGVTVARVAFRKKDSRGDYLVGLEMNMTQMYSSSADFLLDPEVIYQDPRPEGEGVEVYFTGAYCLERDILLKRKIHLPKLPALGDLVMFFNTAGYMMHFFESEAHLFPLANNLMLKKEGLVWEFDDFQLDEQ